ncbi:hypothetical protein HYR99_17955 [Candidatus Poribacteria bacterium]|nr:hypothetical protein [Candidatus Poribacteria bacterium]
MFGKIFLLTVVLVLAFSPLSTQAVELIVNGTFEGGFAGAGFSGPLDGLADSLPFGWTRFENFSGA